MRASSFGLLPLLFLFLWADIAASRKDAGEYWRMVMKDEAMPEELAGLLHQNSEIQSETKPHSQHHVERLNHECDEVEPLVTIEKKIFVQDIEAKPSVTGYSNDLKPWPTASAYNNGDLGAKGIKFTKNFESRHSASFYNNGNHKDEVNKFAKDFEPRPSLTSYKNGDLGAEEKIFTQDFEPRPSLTSYKNGDLGAEEKIFTQDFEPRPSLTSYKNGDLGAEEKIVTQDFEPRPSVTSYKNDNLGSK